MTDRDDYPDNPYRGLAGRERGGDYDPLTDALPAQQPPRGRRARPEPTPGPESPGTGEPAYTGRPTSEFRAPGYAPGPEEAEGRWDPNAQAGRRRRAEPAEEPPRRVGAAEALRGSRAARSSRSRDERPPAPQAHDGLAALANLGAPSAPERPAEAPRRARRARPDDESAPPPSPAPSPSPLWDEDDGPTPSFLADDSEEGEPRPRRARRKRGASSDEASGRRARRGRGAEEPRDTNAFPAVAPGTAGRTGRDPFEAAGEPAGHRARRKRGGRVPEEPSTAPPEEPPPGRRARRGRGAEEPRDTNAFPAAAPAPADTGAFASAPSRYDADGPDHGTPHAADGNDGDFDDGDDAVEAEAAPRRRGGRRRAARGAEPTGRRSRRKRGGRVPEEPPAEEDEDDGYEEPLLSDIAEAYGGGRRSRKKLKNAKRGASARRRRSKRTMIVLALVLVLVVAGGGYGVVRTYVFPPDFTGEGSDEVVFVIGEGESGTAVAQNLEDAGIVASVRAFTNALEAVPPEERGEGLVPGSYSLNEGMSGESAVAALLDPENQLGGRVTFREGLRAEEILSDLAAETGRTEEELQDALAQTDELGLPEYAVEGPAGYLYPETYRFDPNADALSILRTMVTQFNQVADDMELEERAAETPYDANEIMAIASIVQAETGNNEDMGKIARVVYNRMDVGMPLQMDSTCFYAIGDYGIALTEEQEAACEADTSGFDTYNRVGLIPGPFVSPGRAAIEAALEPAEGDWLYFVATDPENGVTEFSTTLEDHQALVERFNENWDGE